MGSRTWIPGPFYDSSLLCGPDESPHSSVCTITWNLKRSRLGKRVSNDARKQGGRQVSRNARTLAPGETVSCVRAPATTVCVQGPSEARSPGVDYPSTLSASEYIHHLSWQMLSSVFGKYKPSFLIFSRYAAGSFAV